MESSLEVILSLLTPDHVTKIVVFLGAMLCNLSGMYQHFGGTCCLHITLKMEAPGSVELLVHVYEST
jgi:hypothetical protein